MSLLARYPLRRTLYLLRFVRCYSEVPDRDQPVKFTTSEASNWRAEFSRRGNISDDSPDAQPIIISFSLAAFLFYFLIWREESDIDKNFDIFRNIYDRVEDLEEVQLKVIRQEYIKTGKDVRHIDTRLEELERVRIEKSGQLQSVAV